MFRYILVPISMLGFWGSARAILGFREFKSATSVETNYGS